MKIKILKLKDLEEHDVYEFCYAQDYPNHWNKNSVYVASDDFWLLCPYLDKLFPEYRYDGMQKMYMSDWKKIEEMCLKKNKFKEFFSEIDRWIKKKENSDDDYFWIMGI